MNGPIRSRRRPAVSGDSGGGVKNFTRIEGNESGDINVSSSSFTDVTGINVNLDETTQVVAGDLLLITWSAQWYISSATNTWAQTRIAINSTVHPSDRGWAVIIPNANSHFFGFTEVIEVTQGMIDAGEGGLFIRPQFCRANGGATTLTIRNDGTNGTPIFTVTNLGQVA